MLDIQERNIEILAKCSVIDTAGKSRVLGSFWEEQRAALVFVRHFG